MSKAKEDDHSAPESPGDSEADNGERSAKKSAKKEKSHKKYKRSRSHSKESKSSDKSDKSDMKKKRNKENLSDSEKSDRLSDDSESKICMSSQTPVTTNVLQIWNHSVAEAMVSQIKSVHANSSIHITFQNDSQA